MWDQFTTVANELYIAATGRRRLGERPARLRPGREVWHRQMFAEVGSTREIESSHAGRDERIRRVESILFLAREPLSSRKLSQYANLADATEARTLVRRLNELFDARGSAFRVEEVAGGFQLLTRAHFAPWIRRLRYIPGETRLSAPAMETLAVVAYRQPIPRADVEAIRGVSCGEILRQLMERDLVRIRGRSEELGRPYLYGTTRRFLQLTGLKSLDHLPRAAELQGDVQDKRKQEENSQDAPRQDALTASDREDEEDSDVTATIAPEVTAEELLEKTGGDLNDVAPRCSDEDDGFGGDFDEVEDEEPDAADDEDEDDDDDDEDDDYDDDDYDDDFDDEDDEDDDDEFSEDDEWEEVGDDDDEDDDWDDDDDDDDDLDWESDEDDEEEEWD